MQKILCSNHEAHEEKAKKGTIKLLLLIPFLIFAPITYAEPYKVGTQLSDFTLKDQHGKTHKLNQNVRLILFAGRDMRGGELVTKALENASEGYLAKYNTIYIVDISGMPRMVSKLFAMPKLRKRPYKILLDPGPSVTKDFPSEKEKVTLLYMNNRTIKEIAFLASPEDVKKAVEKMKQEGKGSENNSQNPEVTIQKTEGGNQQKQ
jgi:hypothetical protein